VSPVIESLGIRFARAERFAPPELLPWDTSTGTGRFGDACPQPPGEVFMASDMTKSEDCLHLNVWTPSLDGRRPVLVWIHGGGYRQGSGDHFLSRGQVLAERGDVVVVTMNYRLGALGFAAHPDLAANLGLLDQQAGLRWVRENIAGFGGDPANVTLFGESAGAGSVGMQLIMPGSAGLFERAIMESGAGRPVPMERAARLTEELATELGVPVTGLRDVAADDLVTAQTAVEARRSGAMVFAPVIDGDVVVDEAEPAGVPLIAGTNVDEWKLLGMRDPKRADLDEDGLRRRVERATGDRTAEVIDVYRDARAARGEGVSPADLWYAIQTDVFFRVPALRTADRHAGYAPTFAYLFGWRSPALDGWLGACHVLEIPFVFGLQGTADLAGFTGSGPDADALSDRMMSAWLAFARGEEPWLRHDPGTRPTMVFDVESRIELAPREPERAVLDAVLPA
jgi:para-nitrobenzyl esterase